MSQFNGLSATGVWALTITTEDTGGNFVFTNLLAWKLTLTVAPTLTALTPNPNPPIAGLNTTITLNGTGFDPANALIIISNTAAGTPCTLPSVCTIANSSLIAKSGTSLTGSINIAVSGTYTVVVRNGATGTPSNPLTVVVAAPIAAPSLTSVVPNPSPPTAGQAFTLTANGSGFDLPTALISITTATAGHALHGPGRL